MPRDIAGDFKGLADFIESYSLKQLAENKDFWPLLSQQHKKYFSYLYCVAELGALKTNSKLRPVLAQKQLNFLIESCSDVGNAMFVMTHGAYKAARMMLRSSIETFLKGISLDELPAIDKVKSVYEIFDLTKQLAVFSNLSGKGLFDAIHNIYKVLCQDAHTATEINMQQITALKYFPTFKIKEAASVSLQLSNLSSIYCTIVCIKFNQFFLEMHYNSKENILNSIPKKYRRVVLGMD